jgi:hypothetical protein
LSANAREAIPMSVFPFIASSMPRADPPPICTSIRTPGCIAEKRLATATIMGVIVLEPVMRSFPDAGTAPFPGGVSLAWTPTQPRHADNKHAEN